MKKIFSLAIVSSFVILTACDLQPKPGDNTPPKVIVSEGKVGLPVIHNTAITPDKMPTITACTDGTRPYETKGSTPAEQLEAQNVNHILPPGQERVSLLFSLNDLSGVKSARLTVAASSAVFHKPALVPTALEKHGGGTALFYEWIYAAPSAGMKSPVLQEFEVTPSATKPGTPFNLSVTDGAGNETETIFFIGRYKAYCKN